MLTTPAFAAICLGPFLVVSTFRSKNPSLVFKTLLCALLIRCLFFDEIEPPKILSGLSLVVFESKYVGDVCFLKSDTSHPCKEGVVPR